MPTLLFAASIYETQKEFLNRAFSESPPEPGIIWLNGAKKSSVRQLLGHDYPALRLRYWCQAGRSAWILDEVGKELPITVGVIVEKDYIRSLRVLTYRENRGGEVVYPETPEFMASKIPELITLGVRIIGGCCGTTPEHIRAIRSAVDRIEEDE